LTLVTGPRRSLSLKLSDTRVYAPQIRARLGTTAHFCEVVVLKQARFRSPTAVVEIPLEAFEPRADMQLKDSDTRGAASAG